MQLIDELPNDLVNNTGRPWYFSRPMEAILNRVASIGSFLLEEIRDETRRRFSIAATKEHRDKCSDQQDAENKNGDSEDDAHGDSICIS